MLYLNGAVVQNSRNITIKIQPQTITVFFTFWSFMCITSSSRYQVWEQLGHICLEALNRYHTLWSMDAIGVTPIPEPISTACSELNTSLVPVPYGPSM